VKGADEWRRVHANRDLLARSFGLRYDDLVLAQQVHGKAVAVVERSSSRAAQGGIAGVDALVTAEPGLGLVVLAADCLPVLLADPVAGVVGAAHAGRQGLVAGVLQETVAALCALGARSLTAVVGPAAGRCCYEVPQDLADAVERAVPGSRAVTRRGTPAVDLRAGATRLLEALDVEVRQVEACTIDDERFYSYRRDRETGRHGGLVALV
jgi:YfiH family protein